MVVSVLKILVLIAAVAVGAKLILKNPKNSLFLLVATFPIFNVDTLDIGGGFFVLSPNKVLGALVVVLMLMDVVPRGKELKIASPQMLLSILLLAMLLLSFMVNGGTNLSWAQRYVSNVAFLLAMVTWIETRAEADRIREVFIASLVVVVISGYFGVGGPAETGLTAQARFDASMLNANRAATCLLIGLGLCLGWFFRNLKDHRRGWAGFAVLVLLSYLLMLTGSRAGLIAMLIIWAGVPFLLWPRQEGRRFLVPMFFGALVLVVFMPQVMVERAQEIPTMERGLTQEEARRTRIHQYRLAIQLINENPVAGVGPQEFKKIYARRVESSVYRVVHSWYLSVATDAGIPALVLFLLMFAVTIGASVRGALRSPDPGLRAEGWTTALLVVGLMAFGVVSSVPYSKLNWFVFALGGVELRLQELERKALLKTGQLQLVQGDSLPGRTDTVVVIKKS